MLKPCISKILFNKSRVLWLVLKWSSYLICFLPRFDASAQPIEKITVASKRFTESYLLAEIISQTLEKKTSYQVSRKPGLGNTAILFSALKQGEIDIYPEYVGTITKEILKDPNLKSIDQINQQLLPLNIQAGVFLGFHNSYALAMKKDLATQLNILRISDLAKHPQLKIGLSHEFLGRQDGWPAIKKNYQLDFAKVIGLDHGFSYQALEKNQVEVIDAYTTDAGLVNPNVVLLQDDQHFFPSYDALLLYRIASLESKKNALEAIQNLSQKITQIDIQKMNYAIEFQGQSIENVAKTFVSGQRNPDKPSTFFQQIFADDFIRISLEHSALVITSLLLAMFIGIPIGIMVFCKPQIGHPILYVSGILQTIPSLALLAFLITIFQTIGAIPAITALSLYALLPIIENTNAGLCQVNPALKESAKALGASFWVCLFKIELPASTPTIISGIKIAAITATGTATIAAFVGAGGYGERIAQGLATNNTQTMLAGAIPAALFAMLMQMMISQCGRYLSRLN